MTTQQEQNHNSKLRKKSNDLGNSIAQSALTKLTHQSQLMIEEISKQILNNRLLKSMATGDQTINSEVLSACWQTLGSQISRQMRAGKGVSVPKLGLFTFTHPQIDLAGVTNPDIRQKQVRFPVFISSKDFAQGQCKSCVCIGKNLRPLPLQLASSVVPVQPLSIIDLSISSNYKKQTVQLAIDRILIHLSEKAKSNDSFSIQIPSIGILYIRHKLIAMDFDPQLTQDLRSVVRKFGLAFSKQMSPPPKVSSLTKSALLSHHNSFQNSPYISIQHQKQRPKFSRHSSLIKNRQFEPVLTPKRKFKAALPNFVFTLVKPDTQNADKALKLDTNFLHQIQENKARARLLAVQRDTNKQKMISRKAFNQVFQVLNIAPGNETFSLQLELQVIIQLTKTAEKSIIKYEDFLNKITILINEIKELKSYYKQRESNNVIRGSSQADNLPSFEVSQLKIGQRPSTSLITSDHSFRKQKSPRGISLQPLNFNRKQLNGGGLLSPKSNNGSALTTQKPFSRMALVSYMNGIVRNKRRILSQLESNNSEFNRPGTNQSAVSSIPSSSLNIPSTKMTISQALTLLKRLPSLQTINFSLLKSILIELGIDHHGSSISILILIKRAENYLKDVSYHPQSTSDPNKAQISISPLQYINKNFATSTQFQKMTKTALQVIQDLRDCFYKNPYKLSDIYIKYSSRNDEGCPGMRRVTFKRLVEDIASKYGRNFSQYQIYTAFNAISSDGQFLSLQQFESNFKWRLPSKNWNQKDALKQVKEWMRSKNLDVESAFDRLMQYRKLNLDHKLYEQDFEKGCRLQGLPFSAPQSDYVFTLIDKDRKGYIIKKDFAEFVVDDSDNPLQIIRETIRQHGLNPEQLLRKMNLSMYSDPLGQKQFCAAVKRLDYTLRNEQIFKLFISIVDSQNDKISIRQLIANLTGNSYQTVDFRNDVYKKIYQGISGKIQEMREIFDEVDRDHDGHVTQQDFIKAIKNHWKGADQATIRRFLPFLDYGKFGKMIKYEKFLQNMGKIAMEKNFNPLQTVLKRLKYFLGHNKQTPESLIQ